MSVTDFECAIAKSQIGRYISGENLAPEIARQLESHINNCARCKLLLEEKKHSLEAMIVEDRNVIQVESAPIPMTSGSSALKPDYMEALAESARHSLREKLGEQTRTKKQTIEVPIVASAFAYKDAEETETIQLQIEAPAKSTKKRGFSLSSLALFKEVPDETTRPAMTMENIRAAKAVINTNSSMRKPTLYLAGLCAVVAAMSFVLRDPTTLFGGKVAGKTMVITPGRGDEKANKVVKKPTSKFAKVVPHKPVQLLDKGTDAAMFTNEPAPKAKSLVKPKLKKVTKSAISPKAKPAIKPKTTQNAQEFTAASKPKVRRHTPVTKRKAKTNTDENTVKLYTPDTTPQTQEQK